MNKSSYSDRLRFADQMKMDEKYALVSHYIQIGDKPESQKYKGLLKQAKHHADFYYVLKVTVEDESFSKDELKISEVNSQNGNDTFSPHSPKVLFY